ncbi:MAG: NHLP family bacteriocin export ABC transporter peptidase/permease/ATPase subunit [Bacillota bacterium]|nr:NHLP family bacteriocin export ABC transporter peptidase/permease/ATPase subunit [Bacillota bacterium]
MADKRIKSPVKKGVVKVPVIMQLEALECGAASLAMVLAYYDKWVPLEVVRRDCGVSRDGSNALNVIKAARNYNLTAAGYKLELEDIKNEATFPCIIHWNLNHFVVLNGFKNNRAYLNDPARGNVSVSMEEFDHAFTGIALMFEPNENFEPGGKPKSMIEFARRRLKGNGTAAMFVLITTIISSLISIISPGFYRVFIDRLLTGKNPEWVYPFLALLILFDMILIITSLIQTIYTLRINGKMVAVGSTSYFWKVLNMPMEFFSQRMTGDIQGRMNSNGTIANTLISTFVPLVINVGMMFFYLVVMFRFSPMLSVIGILSVFINSATSTYISKKRVNITRVSMRDNAKLASTQVAGMKMIETIKAAGAENGYFSRWSGYQASANAGKVAFEKLNQYYGLFPAFVSSATNIIITSLGVMLIMQGKFTQGMVMAFQGYLSGFISPAQSLITSGQTLQEMRTQMELIEDVMEYPSDTILRDIDGQENSKIFGRIEIQDVTFGYARLGNPVIKNMSVTIEQGQKVAFVGSSGCGKSTMSKLLTGLYEPWSGKILFNRKTISEIDRSIFKSSVAVVDQDIILFEDTIENNIRMWDDTIESFEVILAARDAQIHDDIMQRPKGYSHKLAEGGKDFSGGQRQRLEIARVLAQDPTIIILDEATSALDAKTEHNVVSAIAQRGITCIVIAHRLSTIRDCDLILVMKQGEIIARGTHEELMETCEYYQELVINE